MTRGSTWLALAPLVGVVGCGNIWGFHNLVEGSLDATVQDAHAGLPDSASVATDGSGDGGTTDDSATGDASEDASDDAGDAESTDASDAGDASDASDAGPPVTTYDASDGATIDAGTDAGDGGPVIPVCSACDGCCDAHGVCQPGMTTPVCGAGGAACQSCSNHPCTLTFSPCCKSGGGCGCSTLLIGGCN